MEDSSDHEPTTKAQQRAMKYFRKRKNSSGIDSDTQQQSCSSTGRNKKTTKTKKKKAPEPQTTEAGSIPEGTQDGETEEYLSVQSTKDKAEQIQVALLEFLTAPKQKISGDVLNFVMTKVTKLQGMLIQSLLRTSHLEGHTEALRNENMCQRQTFETAVENNPPKAMVKRTTYAERIGVKSKVAASSNLKQDPPNVITILPKDTGAFESSDKTKEAVFQLVSPRKDKIQVKNVRRIQGNGILVETANKTDIEILLSNEKLRAAGLLVGAPEKRNPRLIVYDVPRPDNDEATLRSIIAQNVDDSLKAKVRQQLKLAFKTGDKNRDRCNIVLEASKEIRDLLIKKERLYIGWSCCRIRDYVVATRCYKCQSFGHTTKYCKAENEVCGHCSAPGHAFKNCPEKSKPATCSNCKKASRKSDHCVTSNTCPAYISAINQVLARTDYGL